MAAFRGMHVSPAKHSYAWLPRKCDYRTDTHTNTDGRTDRRKTTWSLCAAMLRRRHNKWGKIIWIFEFVDFLVTIILIGERSEPENFVENEHFYAPISLIRVHTELGKFHLAKLLGGGHLPPVPPRFLRTCIRLSNLFLRYLSIDLNQ